MSAGPMGALHDDDVFVTVDITPRPSPSSSPSTVLPPASGGGSSSAWAGLDLGWLPATGFEPAWVVGGGALLLVALGVLLLRARRRASPSASPAGPLHRSPE